MLTFARRFLSTTTTNSSSINVKNATELKNALAKGPALVDFYATWCGPCKLLTPVLERVLQPTTGVQLIKVDIDQAGDLAQEHQVTSVPTVVLFDQDGRKVKSFVGARDEAFVRDFIKMQ